MEAAAIAVSLRYRSHNTSDMAPPEQKVKSETVLSYSSSGVISFISFALILPYTFVTAEARNLSRQSGKETT